VTHGLFRGLIIVTGRVVHAEYYPRGLILRAVGENTRRAPWRLGYKVKRIRDHGESLFGGACAGMVALISACSVVPSMTEGMTAGIAGCALSGWVVLLPSWETMACPAWVPIFLGGVTVIQLNLTRRQPFRFLSSILAMSPYMITILVLVITCMADKTRQPARLGRVFPRRQR